jgi:Protein of unknown function (DUF1264)
MDRRELFGALGSLGAVPVCASAAAADHGGKDDGPLSAPHFHVCGIHMAKENRNLQFITQHYCAAHMKGKEADVFQCVLFDGTGQNARLIGVEYIITDEAYQKLPPEEKKYWHPHTYEVLGGGLIAPGMKPEEEMKFMEFVLTTWGKAWHTWPKLEDALPRGEPLLIWSLTADGQVDPKLLAQRDKQFNVNVKAIRAARGKAIGLEVPNVSAPKDVNVIGRQWTDNGDDKPTKKKP